MPNVFVSYVRQDQETVDRLVESFQRVGINVWLDRKNIRPGQRWKDAIRCAISSGDFFIACFSNAYSSRRRTYMNEELTLAIEELRQRPTSIEWFIPVLLSDCKIPDMTISATERLDSIHAVELHKDWTGGIQSILSVIQPDPEFDDALQKVQALANKGIRTAELLTASTLRTLYLNRYKYSPSQKERVAIFNNLLLQGRGKHFTQRGKGRESETGLEDPAPLGWLWYSKKKKEDLLISTRSAIDHRHVHVRAGAVRALRRLGNKQDAQYVRKMFDDNDLVASKAVRAMVRLGDDNDISYVVSLYGDKRSDVKAAVAHVIGYRGTFQDERILFDLLKDDNMMVKRAAVKALGIRYYKRRSAQKKYIVALEKIINEPSEAPQVRTAAKEVMKALVGQPIPLTDSYDRKIIKATSRLGLTKGYSDEKFNTARKTLFQNPGADQEAGIRWVVDSSPEKAKEFLDQFAIQIHIRALQRLDYYLYCPKWWREAIELPEDFD